MWSGKGNDKQVEELKELKEQSPEPVGAGVGEVRGVSGVANGVR